MNEFYLLLVINIISASIAIGSYTKTLKYIEDHIMVAVEQSTKSAHHRIDELLS